MTTTAKVSTRGLTHPDATELELTAVLAALADPHRLGIVRELAAQQTTMACSAFELPLAKSTTTHHFKVLREAGIIRQHYEGTSRMSALRSDDLEARFPGLLTAVLAA